MKVFFLTSEMPFSKVGGLADVSGSLPTMLHRSNVDIRIATPYYLQVKSKAISIDEKIAKFTIKDLAITCQVIVYQTLYQDIPVYLIDIPQYFNREGVYTYQTGEGFSDNAERFGIFCWAVLQLLTYIDWIPDLFHLNDWHTAFLPVWLRTSTFQHIYTQNPNIKTLLVIHNIVYQGEFLESLFDKLHIVDQAIIDDFKFNSRGNPLKAGIINTDAIVAVSPSYALEIQTAEYGANMQHFLLQKRANIFGILNGVDYNIWDPETDKLIPQNYSIVDLEGKKVCKKVLQQKLGFQVNESLPLIGMVSRLAHQKGFDIIIPSLDPLLDSLDFQFVLLGSGNVQFAHSLKEIEKRWRDKVSINIEYNESLVHLIEAGADFFLMPSKYEPCGLNQMYSMKYGTFPIVRETGGLKDSVVDIEQFPEAGTGFSFKEYNSIMLQITIKRVINWYKDHKTKDLDLFRKQIMKKDFSWKQSAKQYLEVYEKILKKQ